jgi:ubiquinone/menaquinone biosynthesis C-methylase UbiE
MNIKAAAKYKLRKVHRFLIPKRIANYKTVRNFVKDKTGIEIGGPSKVFNDIIKVYTIAKRIDGCNFATNTIWEGNIAEGNRYEYGGNSLGSQFINDATDLNNIENEKYDFLLSSHCLEHVANPIKALKEWHRVLKDDGLMVLVLPNPEFTYDHKRKRTSFQHLLDDFNNNIDESDTTHIQDVIDNCDLSRVYLLNGNGATISYESHVSISKDNFKFRAIHHHVYTDEVVYELLKYSGFKLLASEHFTPFHMIYLGFKKRFAK